MSAPSAPRPRFLLDEPISPEAADELKRRGVDALSIAGSAHAGLDDEAVLNLAVAEGRIAATYNIADFALLHADFLSARAALPGILFVSARTIPTSDPRGLARALAALARRIESGEVDASGGLFLGA